MLNAMIIQYSIKIAMVCWCYLTPWFVGATWHHGLLALLDTMVCWCYLTLFEAWKFWTLQQRKQDAVSHYNF